MLVLSFIIIIIIVNRAWVLMERLREALSAKDPFPFLQPSPLVLLDWILLLHPNKDI